MSGILRLESLTKGNTLKQGDKTPLKYRLFDADGEKLNIAGKSAKVRLVYPDFLTIGYEKDGLTVAQDDTVTFTIDGVIPAKLYHVEIIVDNKFIFPSRADETKFTVDKSSFGTETNIIEIVGVDAIVRKAVDLINDDPSLIIDEDKLVTDIIANTGIKNIDEYYQQYNDVITDLSEEKDYHSLPEISGARGGFDTLGERLDDTTAQLAHIDREARRLRGLNDLDEETLNFIHDGTGGPISVEGVPKDNSVTEKKTTFLEASNLWNGDYSDKYYVGSYSGRVNIVLPSSDKMRSFVMDVSEGMDFTIFKKEGGNRFSIAVTDDLPTQENEKPIDPLYEYRGQQSADFQSHYVSIPKNAKYMVIHVSTTEGEPDSLPELVINSGHQQEIKDSIVFNKPIEGYPRVENKVSSNLFTGGYIEGVGVFSSLTTGEVTRVDSLSGGVVVVVPLKPNRNYEINKLEPSDRFRLTLSDTDDVSNRVDIKEGYGLYGNDELSSFSFTNTDAPFLIIGLSSNGEKPELEVLESYYAIENSEGQEIDFLRSNSVFKHHLHSEVKKELESSRRIPYLTNPIKEIYASPDTLSNVDRSSHLKIYERYDQLVSDFPDYVSKEKIGEDALGNEIFAYNFIAPELTSTPPDKKPYRIELAITTGVHGREWIATLALLRFMEELCYNPRNREEVDEIKWSVDFSIVPIVCPNGFDAVQRNNHNGVNINRNFDSNWVQTGESGSSPASELETQAVQQWLNGLDKTYYFVDFHVISAPTPMGYSPDSETTTLLQGLFRTLTRKWRKDYELPYEHTIYGYTVNPITSGDSTGYARNIGLQSVLLEGASEFFLQESYGDRIAQKQVLDVLANFIIAFVNSR